MAISTAILATRNNIVDDINFNIQKKIPSEESIYKLINKIVNVEESVNFPTRNALTLPSVESPITLLRNLNSPKLCNGKRMIVKQLLNNIIEAELMTGKDQGHTIFIPRIPTELPFQFRKFEKSLPIINYK